MKTKFKDFTKIVLGTIFVGLLVLLLGALGAKTNDLRVKGYINPGAKRMFVWENDQHRWYPKKTVEVELVSGKMVEVDITNDQFLPFCVIYGDYPPAKGKRVLVLLEKNIKDSTYLMIRSGEILEE